MQELHAILNAMEFPQREISFKDGYGFTISQPNHMDVYTIEGRFPDMTGKELEDFLMKIAMT